MDPSERKGSYMRSGKRGKGEGSAWNKADHFKRVDIKCSQLVVKRGKCERAGGGREEVGGERKLNGGAKKMN